MASWWLAGASWNEPEASGFISCSNGQVVDETAIGGHLGVWLSQ